MKVEDLMLGDWVQGFVPDSYSTIYGIFNEQRIAIIAEPSKAYIELSIDDIQPIPLTPEILEKNGFEPYERGNIVHYWKLEEGGVYIIVYNVENDFYVYVHYQKCEIDNAPGYFVHELQHALRLCGISLDLKI